MFKQESAAIHGDVVGRHETARTATIVLAIALSAFSDVAVALVKPDYAYLVLAAVPITVIVLSRDILLAGIMLLYSVGFSTYLAHQVAVGPFPISGLDIAVAGFVRSYLHVVHVQIGGR